MKDNWIPMEQCEDRGIYILRSRNLAFGVYDTISQHFLGIRYKLGDEYIAHEYHWDKGPPFGTAKPSKKIGTLPQDIPNEEQLGSYDYVTKRQVEFDKPVADGGKGWYFVDTGEPSREIRPYSKHNAELFNYLKSLDINVSNM